VSVPLTAAFHAICFFLDGLLFPSLWRTGVERPVFVVGHARSGTTLVHRLLSGDEGRFSSFELYELHFPSLLQKKTIRLVAALDARFLGGALARRVRAWEDRRYAAVRRFHEMGLTIPEEDDIVFYWSCASGYWISRVPWMHKLDFYSVDRWPERKRRRLMRFYRECVRRQLHLEGGGKVHLSKNPIFSGRLEALIETFPDARIVVPMRHPYETIPSLLSLVSAGWRRLPFDEERVAASLRVLAEQSFDTYRHPLEVLERHPETPRTILDYRDLVSDPAATVERAYRDLDLSMSDSFREKLRGEARRARGHRSRHAYSLEKFGLEADAIRTRLGDLFDRYHWDEEADA
ncbi:MAG: sulfotransferase, partial [Myxococcales bacterium]|nr:sulfotransferase [Myxococcales bacterium]